MKKSVRALRIERRRQRTNNSAKLSLVSLMDIFTILVFFLMVNASSVQVLQNEKSIVLPKSVSEDSAEETLVIMVNSEHLLVQGRKVLDINTVNDENSTIEALAKELAYQRNRLPVSAEQQEQGLAITIMGDQQIQYKLLKKIMTTCAEQGFTNIALAVEQLQENTEVRQEANAT